MISFRILKILFFVGLIIICYYTNYCRKEDLLKEKTELEEIILEEVVPELETSKK